MGKHIPYALMIVIIILLLIPNTTSNAEIEKEIINREPQVFIVYVYVNQEDENEESRVNNNNDMQKINVEKMGNKVTIQSVDKLKYETYEITAFTAGVESTGKSKSHPEYGITASGARVKENHTLACPKSLEFGTKIYIPYFDNTFVCEDRGSKITKGHLDVYMEDLEDALEFGRRDLPILILKDGET